MERDARIEVLESALATARGEWERASSSLAARDGQIAELQSALAAQQAVAQHLSAELAKRAAKLEKLKRSFSWRTTAPLRWSGRAIALGCHGCRAKPPRRCCGSFAFPCARRFDGSH